MSGYTAATAAVIAVVGSVTSGVMAAQAGSAQQKSYNNQAIGVRQKADYNAKVMRTKAGQERAATQRRMIEGRRESAIVESDALAAAAAGGDASSAGVMDILSDMSSEGEIAALNSFYEGEERALGLESAANVGIYEGGQGASAYRFKGRSAANDGQARAFGHFTKAATTTVTKGSSMYGKYGG